MFGNHPLPNIAPSLLLFLPPPPPDVFPPPPPPPTPLRLPAWAKRGRAHHRRWRPRTMPCHRCVPSPHHPLSTVPTSGTRLLPLLPSSRDVGERHLARHPPPMTSSPCHHQMPRHPPQVTTARATSHSKSACCRTPHHEDQGSEGGRKRSKRGKERERGNRGWGGGHSCPLPPVASF